MSDGVAAIVALRIVLALFAAAVLALYGTSLVRLTLGSQSLAELGRADRAFYALSFLTGQVFFLAWPKWPLLMLALVLGGTGLGLSIEVARRARAKRLARIDDMIDNPQFALPLLELAEADPERASAFAQQIRAATVEARIAP